MQVDFVKQLHRQLGFLERSCKDFDASHVDEALRMAVNLRVLFHDTNCSTSILTHLNKKGTVKLLTTFDKIEEKPGELTAVILLWVDSTGRRSPPLGKCPRQEFIPINEWWEELIITGNNRLTRKDIILAAANEDGGAHVAANPRDKAQELIEGAGTFTVIRGGVEVKIKLDNQHFNFIRQFSYEVLHSPDLISLC